MTTRQGLWQVDVYQAKTGTKIASRIVQGSLNGGTCSPETLVAPNTAKDTEADTAPDEGAYGPALSSLVNGN